MILMLLMGDEMHHKLLGSRLKGREGISHYDYGSIWKSCRVDCDLEERHQLYPMAVCKTDGREAGGLWWLMGAVVVVTGRHATVTRPAPLTLITNTTQLNISPPSLQLPTPTQDTYATTITILLYLMRSQLLDCQFATFFVASHCTIP